MNAMPSDADQDRARRDRAARPFDFVSHRSGRARSLPKGYLRHSDLVNRRDFLRLATQGLLALGGLFALGGVLRFLGYEPDPAPPTEFDLGPAANYPPGSRTVIAAARAVLLRTPSGFAALSLVCPHLGCEVRPDSDGFACPCHGSRFGAAGLLLRGPANRPLRPLRVEQNAQGNLILRLN